MDIEAQTLPPTAPAKRHRVFLHRHFALLWLGQTLSGFGSRITREGLPLAAVLTLRATPFQMSLLAALGAIPALLIGPFAGVWVDRLRRRPILILADLGRAALLCIIPLAALLGLLRIELLYVVAALVGTLTVFFTVAYRSFLPTLLRREDILEGNSKLEASDSLAEIGGPPLAGLLVQLLTAPLAILFDALSFLVSAFSVALIRLPEPRHTQQQQQQDMWCDIRDGWRFLFNDRLLRTLAFFAGTGSFCGGFFATLYTLFVVGTLGITPAGFGLVVAMGGVGGLAGALLASRITRRYGLGKTFIGAVVLAGTITFLTPLAAGPAIVALAMLMLSQLVGDCGAVVYSINFVSLLQTRVPDRYLGRVNASMHLLENGILPIGALTAGILASFIGIRLTLLVAASIRLVSCMWVIFSLLKHHMTTTSG